MALRHEFNKMHFTSANLLVHLDSAAGMMKVWF